MSTNDHSQMNRRTFLKTVGVGTGAAAVGSTQTPLSPIGDANAFACGGMCVAAIGGGIATAGVTGWAVREFEILGKDDPPEGLTPGALKSQVYQTAEKRKSVNQSTFVDNRNMVGYVTEPALSDAKIAAIEALNDGKTKSEVVNAGELAANSHFATIESNFLNSWEESAAEYENLVSTVQSQGDVSFTSVFFTDASDFFGSTNYPYDRTEYAAPTTYTVTLADGSTMDLTQIGAHHINEDSEGFGEEMKAHWCPTNTNVTRVKNDGTADSSSNPSNWEAQAAYDGQSVKWLSYSGWNNLWSDLQSQFDSIRSEITLWVDTIYGDVQAGDIDPSQLISGTELAGTLGEDVPQAIADLAALNIPVDLNNQLTIELNDGTVMAGYLGVSNDSDITSLSAGDSVDPSTLSGDVYFAVDIAELSQPWTQWDSSKGIDGGTLHLTADPTVIDGIQADAPLLHTIDTAAGETVTVPVSEYTETTNSDGTTVWEIDLSDDLDTGITSVESITVTIDAQSAYTTTIIDQPFTVESTENGEPIEPGQSREPQTDSNYITQQEWEQFKQQRQDLIDRYQQAKKGNGVPSFGGLPFPAEWLIYGFLGIAGLAGLNAASG